ncbi:MAG: LacI family DNA-binding transcriptional regulator [Woeseia sp.]|nr:LacI family DNA-binding transcriptional regulator [Woeseia sp.]
MISKSATFNATLSDVAERAGVSIKTASRVVNNEEHVRPTTRAQVLAAVVALNYRPNEYARYLASRRSSHRP